MRTRACRDKMLKRVDPWRGSLKPGSPPHTWVLPQWFEFGSPEMDAAIQERIQEMREYWLAPGCDLQMALVGTASSLFDRAGDLTVEFRAVRRDTNYSPVARWLSDPAERTLK